MKALILFYCLLIISFTADCQSLDIPKDSSSIMYPDQAKILLSRKTMDNKTWFMMERKDFKGLITITNYFLQRLDLSTKNIAIHKKNDSLFDSTVTTLRNKLEAERNRNENFKIAFEEFKKITNFYDQQLLNCSGDLARLKNKRKTNFVKGSLFGLAVGLAGGLVVGLAN